MPIYTLPQQDQPGTDPVLEAAKNFMQSPAYARQFMGNLEGAMTPQPPMGGGHDHGAHGAGGMSPAAQAAYAALSELYPDLVVNSAYRDPEHNARVGGAKNSQHVHGNAYDFSVAGWEQPRVGQLIRDAQDVGFTGIGVYDNAVHFDVGPQRYWGPSYGRESFPEWALPYLRTG